MAEQDFLSKFVWVNHLGGSHFEYKKGKLRIIQRLLLRMGGGHVGL